MGFITILFTKLILDLNGFYNYSVHFLRPKNNKSGEPEINNIGDKLQDKNDFIIHNVFSDEILNQIIYMIE